MEVVLQLVLVDLAHVGHVGRRFAHRGDAALHAGRNFGRVPRPALEAPHLWLGAAHTAAAHNHAPMLTRPAPFPNAIPPAGGTLYAPCCVPGRDGTAR